MGEGSAQALPDGSAQGRRGQDFAVGAVFEDVHQKFLRVLAAVGQAELVAAVREPGGFLVRVPGLGGNPAGAMRGEVQHGLGVGGTGEDAEGAGKVLVQLVLGDFAGGLVQGLGCGDAVQGEAAKGSGLVAPGLQIPVAAVPGEALGETSRGSSCWTADS